MQAAERQEVEESPSDDNDEDDGPHARVVVEHTRAGKRKKAPAGIRAAKLAKAKKTAGGRRETRSMRQRRRGEEGREVKRKNISSFWTTT